MREGQNRGRARAKRAEAKKEVEKEEEEEEEEEEVAYMSLLGTPLTECSRYLAVILSRSPRRRRSCAEFSSFWPTTSPRWLSAHPKGPSATPV